MLRCLPNGTRLAQYEVNEMLGQGGMGHVYAATDTLLDRPVALKVLRGGDRQTLLDEGRALAAIEHAGVVRVYGIDVSGDQPFVVMERIRGESLADRLEREGALPHDETLRILEGVAAGLDAIHRAGRIHGDVKPANILLEEGTGRVVLTDLGLSRVIAHTERLRGGTPEYLAPERARRAPMRPALLPREDVYSLAVVAYEMLTGDVPFDAQDSQEVLRLQAVARPPRPSRARPSLTWRIDRAVLHGLEKSPVDRPATAPGFVDALRRAVRDADQPADLLVADDDRGLLELMARQLARRLRCTVRTAACGETAFESAARRTPWSWTSRCPA
ncbi:MAG: serine/threonine-protein kinase [Myxococcota bacterium]|nr:serine/threonine-protein kinase [Myxococcota bacterium]